MTKVVTYTHMPGNLGEGHGGNCFSAPDLANNILLHGALIYTFKNPGFCDKWYSKFDFERDVRVNEKLLTELGLICSSAHIKYGSHNSVNKSDYNHKFYDSKEIQSLGRVGYRNGIETSRDDCGSEDIHIEFGYVDDSSLSDEKIEELMGFAKGIETFSNMPYFLARAYDRFVVNNKMPTTPKQFRTFFYSDADGNLERIVEEDMPKSFLEMAQDIAISTQKFGMVARKTYENPDDSEYINLRTRVESEPLLREKLDMLVEHNFLPIGMLRMYGLDGYY